jgi:hypothetical protein
VRRELGNELLISERQSGVPKEAGDETAQTHAPAPAAVLAREVNAKPGSIAHRYTRCVEQVAQHAAPRVLTVGSASADQSARTSDERVTLKDCFGGFCVAQRRKDECGGSSVEVV